MARPDAIAEISARLLGSEVTEVRGLHGGDLSVVCRLHLADGRQVIAKTGNDPRSEADMLAEMRASGADAPEPLAWNDDVVILTDLGSSAPPGDASWERLAETLLALHGRTADSYGWSLDYAFGDVGIPNARSDDWHSFWANQRLLAGADGLPDDLARRIEELCQRLPDFIPAAPPASLLHGDLWTGNVHFTADSGAWLIDPACYFGDAEVDLAMLALFGTPPERFWDSYGGLEPGWRERRSLYQLWPALVHLRLFGTSYRPLIERLLSTLGA